MVMVGAGVQSIQNGLVLMNQNQSNQGGGGASSGSGGSGGAGPTETFADPAAAIGDVYGVATKVGQAATKNPQWINWGYTQTYYYEDSNGVQNTVFYNPSTRTYSGGHPSSGQ